MAASGLVDRFRAHVSRAGGPSPGRAVAVAVSGGRDSVALLHLLRFAARDLVADLHAIHVDHRMRPESTRDAAWVAGLCRAWSVPLEVRSLEVAPGNEEEARLARYRHLYAVAEELGGALVATGHHRDDQAETVLFRAVRGSGPAGLGGIRSRTKRVWRPLLPFTRAEITAYARAGRLTWREDRTNLDPDRVRNVLRLEVLPAIERAVPGASESLARLGRLAAADERAWSSVLGKLERDAVVHEGAGFFLLARPIVCSYDRAVRRRLVRRLAGRLGARVRRTASALADAFLVEAVSGKGVDLGGGVRLEREFDHFRLSVRPAPRAPGPTEASIVSEKPGAASLELGGAQIRVAWEGGESVAGADASAARFAEGGAGQTRGRFAAPRLAFPLTLRPTRPGDRVRMPYGHKRVAKLLAERRIPRSQRAAVAVLVDRDGEPLWVPGVVQAEGTAPREGEPVLNVRVWDERDD
ncbi:MAG: tRNA lysidine(34) synthetase TilS [Gemmatimonadota bacterium]